MKKEYIHFRIKPEVKDKASEKAKKEGTTLSEVIRSFLDRWIKK